MGYDGDTENGKGNFARWLYVLWEGRTFSGFIMAGSIWMAIISATLKWAIWNGHAPVGVMRL